jgi:hypothetical protein
MLVERRTRTVGQELSEQPEFGLEQWARVIDEVQPAGRKRRDAPILCLQGTQQVVQTKLRQRRRAE